MRQITKDAVKAFMNRETFNRSNTKVNYDEFIKTSTMKLRGNNIALLNSRGKLFITNAGWQSNTTKERLNALKGVSIAQKAGVWYLNGKEWEGELVDVAKWNKPRLRKAKQLLEVNNNHFESATHAFKLTFGCSIFEACQTVHAVQYGGC